MNQRQFAIFQGSTPTIEMRLPFEIPQNAVAFATFSQNESVLEYGLNGTARSAIAGAGSLTISGDNADTLLLSMTQTDTLRLEAGDVLLQLRIRTDDGADTFFPVPGHVGPAFRPGVI